MDYRLRFRLDVKKNIYQSKKEAGAEPYYQIGALVSINGRKEVNYYTGYKAQKGAWFGSVVEARKSDGNRTFGIHKGCLAKKGSRLVQYSDANRALDLISATILTLSAKHSDLSKEELVGALDEALGKNIKATVKNEEKRGEDNMFWQLAELYCKDRTVSEGRLKSRVNAMNHLRRFEQYMGQEITFECCNANLLTRFNVFLDNDSGEYDSTPNPRNRARKKNHNTVSKIMACVKQFFRWSRKQYGVTDYGNIMDYSVPTPRYGDPVTLTQEEKRQLWNTKFENEELEFTRDLFYFQCSVGCRVSDFFGLKYENLIDEEDGSTSIYYCPRKTQDVTAVNCRIPLSPNALAIVNKYREQGATSKTPLFRFPKHKQIYNSRIKKMFREAGLNRKVTVYNSYNQMQIKPLYEVAISKFARSCFVDVLVGKGVSDSVISTMSGHTAGSKAFHRYHNSRKVEQQNRAVAMLD